MGNDYHKTVLLDETIAALNIKPEKKYIDATIGGGGHTQRIIDMGGVVLGIDVDEDAIRHVVDNQKLNIKNQKLILVKGNFKDIDILAKEKGFKGIAGAVFDLGVSSHQLDTADRGFSFVKDARLDMRMDRDLSVKAIDLVNILTKGELYELFNKFGESRFARVISESIVRARQIEPIITTNDLSEIIAQVVKSNNFKINPATKAFQALRIAINDEINNLTLGLTKAIKLLTYSGRICVISFHSLEDRIVKNTFREWYKAGIGRIITKKPIVPTEREVLANRRSRSAKLRIFEKL